MPYDLALQAHTGNNGAKTGQIEEFKTSTPSLQ
jgi:hypothetical protein